MELTRSLGSPGSPLSCGRGLSTPGLTACRRVGLIKNNCLARVMSFLGSAHSRWPFLPWQAPSPHPGPPCCCCHEAETQGPLGTFTGGEGKPGVGAHQVRRGSKGHAAPDILALAQFYGTEGGHSCVAGGESRAQRVQGSERCRLGDTQLWRAHGCVWAPGAESEARDGGLMPGVLGGGWAAGPEQVRAFRSLHLDKMGDRAMVTC